MKKLLILCASVLLFSCSQSVDEVVAKEKAAQLLELIKNHEYEKTADYYSPQFNESESVSARKSKFEEIENASGKMLSIEHLNTADRTIDDRHVIELTYKVKCENTTLNETLLMANEEGDVKVIAHSVSNK